MAEAVTQSGSVIGVDVEPAMVEEAGRRVEDKPWVEVRLGDAHALPVPDESVDRARVDRMVQHVAEFGRVLRPGGLACVAEPDWDSLVIDPGDAGTNRAFTRFVCSTMVGNATVGRQLARLAHGGAAGGVRRGRGRAGVRDFTLADKIQIGRAHV